MRKSLRGFVCCLALTAFGAGAATAASATSISSRLRSVLLQSDPRATHLRAVLTTLEKADTLLGARGVSGSSGSGSSGSLPGPSARAVCGLRTRPVRSPHTFWQPSSRCRHRPVHRLDRARPSGDLRVVEPALSEPWHCRSGAGTLPLLNAASASLVRDPRRLPVAPPAATVVKRPAAVPRTRTRCRSA